MDIDADRTHLAMTDPRHLFDGSRTGGVYRMLGPRADILASLRRSGWRTALVTAGDTRRDFLAHIGTALAFPEHYGQNLDALWDCLRDIEEPVALLWTSWHELAIEHPHDWADIITLLEERAQDAEHPFALVLG